MGGGVDVIDVGTYDSTHPVDYPIYGEKVGRMVASGAVKYGVLICSTGIGVMVAANKVKGIRCGIAYTDDVAKQMREHIDANVVAFGQDEMSYHDIEKRVDIFLQTDFAGDYHCHRLQQLADIERDIKIVQQPMQKTF